jgi:hypothetical protein
MMSENGGWAEIRERRLAEPGAAEAYDAARSADGSFLNE